MPEYATVERVQRHLGVDLTADQAAECLALLRAASAWIDGRAGRGWGATTQVTELQTVTGQALYLDRAPVAALASVELRPPTAGATWGTSVVAAYELVDAARGLLLLPFGYAGWWVRVVYTPTQTVDPRVELAAIKLAAHWLSPLLSGSGGAGAAAGVVSRYSLGQELTVQYDTGASAAVAAAAVSALGVPTEVLGLVDQLREYSLA